MSSGTGENHSDFVLENAKSDPDYNPYCLRCSGLIRMKKVEPFYWRCHCGAEHDIRDIIAKEPENKDARG